MKRKILTNEQLIYLCVFLLAFGVRFLRLGAAPLSSFESGWALQALGLSRGEAIFLGTQPFYILFTGFLFTLLGSGNGLARLLPMLAGCALVFVPYLWSRRFVQLRWVALPAAVGLALDPGLVASSRLAGGPALGLTFFLLALGFGLCRSAVWTGIFSGLALLSGVPVVPGLIGLVATLGIVKWLESQGVLAPLGDPDSHPEAYLLPKPFIRQVLLSAGGTILIAGTFFLLSPQGIAAMADSFTAYLRGWVSPSGQLALRLPAALLFYQPLALFLGVVGGVRGWRNREPVIQRLSLWAVILFLLVLVYPARQTLDLVWVLVPLWFLAAWEFQHHLPAVDEDESIRRPAMQFAVGVVILLGVAWLGLIAGGNLLLVVLALVMLAAIALMVAMWSLNGMRYGLIWGSSTALALGMLVSMFGVSQVRPNDSQELWSIPPSTGEARQLLTTIEDLSEWKTGDRQAIDITIVSASSTLRWLLRDFQSAHFTSDFTGAGIEYKDTPSVVITHQSQNITALPVRYRGQDFILHTFPGWSQVLPEDWIAWMAFRNAPLAQDQVILWARTDLFPGGMLEQATVTSGSSIAPNPPPAPDADMDVP